MHPISVGSQVICSSIRKSPREREKGCTDGPASTYSGEQFIFPLQHTLGHLECPACDELRNMYSRSLSDALPFCEAAEIYMRMRSIDATPGAVKSARYIKKNTIVHYERCIRSLNLFFGAMTLKTIHLGHIREYQLARLEGRAPFIRRRRPHEEPRPLPCKAGQVNQEIGLLTAILRRAKVWTDEMKEYYEQLQVDGEEKQRALTPEEQQRWLDVSAMQARWSVVHWYSVLAFDTTCSTNELRALRIGDVDLLHRTINIPWEGSKTRGRRRTIALESADVLFAAERLLERARDLGCVEPQHYLFPFGLRGKGERIDPTRPMTVSGLKRRWEEVRSATRLEWFRMYDTRHTGITRLAERGVPLAVAMSRAGHMSARMSEWYTHVSDAVQRKWMQMPLINGPQAPRPLQAALYKPQPAPARIDERPGYKSIYVGGGAY